MLPLLNHYMRLVLCVLMAGCDMPGLVLLGPASLEAAKGTTRQRAFGGSTSGIDHVQ
jgi:hypothetical protein